MKDWEEISNDLRSNHLYPTEVIEKGKTVALEIYAPPLQKDSRLRVVKDVIGEEPYKANCLPNNDVIVIKKKLK